MRRRAFSLIELLVVIAIIALLATLLLPALVRSKASAQGAVCRSNLKQFAYAWRLYLDENDDRFPPNSGSTGGTSTIGEGPRSDAWVSGWLCPKPNFPANTNITFLRRSLLAPFLKENIAIWRCPGDKSMSLQGERWLPRVRTISMNGYLRTHDQRGVASRFKMNTRMSDLIKPGPSQTWVFTDEREDSIEDNVFVVDME